MNRKEKKRRFGGVKADRGGGAFIDLYECSREVVEARANDALQLGI